MRGGDDARGLTGQQFRLGFGISGQQDRVGP